MKKVKAISILEILIVIAIVTSVVIVTAPTFTRFLRGPLLRYEAQSVAQSIQDIQSNAFITHSYYKITIENSQKQLTVEKYNESWIPFDELYIDPSITIESNSEFNSSHQLIYGPNGNAFFCSITMSLQGCLTTPLQTIKKSN